MPPSVEKRVCHLTADPQRLSQLFIRISFSIVVSFRSVLSVSSPRVRNMLMVLASHHGVKRIVCPPRVSSVTMPCHRESRASRRPSPSSRGSRSSACRLRWTGPSRGRSLLSRCARPTPGSRPGSELFETRTLVLGPRGEKADDVIHALDQHLGDGDAGPKLLGVMAVVVDPVPEAIEPHSPVRPGPGSHLGLRPLQGF